MAQPNSTTYPQRVKMLREAQGWDILTFNKAVNANLPVDKRLDYLTSEKIEAGKDILTQDQLDGLKASLPLLNSDWLLHGVGDMFEKKQP